MSMAVIQRPITVGKQCDTDTDLVNTEMELLFSLFILVRLIFNFEYNSVGIKKKRKDICKMFFHADNEFTGNLMDII